MTPRRALLPFALAFLMSISLIVNAGAGFNDGDFTSYTWSAVEIQDVPGGSSISAGEVPTGGAGAGAFRSNSWSVNYSGTPNSQEIIIANTNRAMVYSPAISGPINSITSFSIAASFLSSNVAPAIRAGLSVPQAGQPVKQLGAPAKETPIVGLLLLQDGIYYTNQLQQLEGFDLPIKESSPQLATDFTQVGSSGPSLNPDFSSNADPIQFGYVLAVSFLGFSPATMNGSVGVDQFAVSIFNTPAMPQFTSVQPVNATTVSVTLSGLAAGESITWRVSTNLVKWSTNNPNPTSTASGTNGTFTITDSVFPTAPNWFLNALVQ
jgi:hypothetical protein